MQPKGRRQHYPLTSRKSRCSEFWPKCWKDWRFPNNQGEKLRLWKIWNCERYYKRSGKSWIWVGSQVISEKSAVENDPKFSKNKICEPTHRLEFWYSRHPNRLGLIIKNEIYKWSKRSSFRPWAEKNYDARQFQGDQKENKGNVNWEKLERI